MRYICENCNATHSTKDTIYKCIECDKECCSTCEANESDILAYCKECVSNNNNYSYPDKFYDFSKSVKISDNNIKEWLEEVKNDLVNNEREWGVYSYTESGNIFILGVKYEDEYVFRVFKNYKEISIDKEDIGKVRF
jgi:hypothetical protein